MPIGENATVPMEMRLQVPGGLVVREPTMNDDPNASRALRFDVESMPASAATTIEAPFKPWRSMKLVTVGTMVVVSAVLHSSQPISRGESGVVDQQCDDDLRIHPTLV